MPCTAMMTKMKSCVITLVTALVSWAGIGMEIPSPSVQALKGHFCFINEATAYGIRDRFKGAFRNGTRP